MKNFASPFSKTLCAGILGVAMALGSLPAAGAVLISGTIDFTGGASLNAPLQTATAYDSFFGSSGPLPTVLGGSQTGDYQLVPTGTQVTINPFLFKPYNPLSVLSIPLWSFSVGATEYSFTATSILVVQQLPGFLNIEGEGVASITGFSDTTATWSFTDTGGGSGPSFNFGGSIAAVPEAPMMPLMMMIALAGCVLPGFKRRGRFSRNPAV
jgi:hypothetical protein